MFLKHEKGFFFYIVTVIPTLKGKDEFRVHLKCCTSPPPQAFSGHILCKCPKWFMAEMFQLIFSSRQTGVITRNHFHDRA